jgi:hypothetical protein
LPIVDLNICVVEPNCALCGDVTQVNGKSTVTSVRRKNEKMIERVVNYVQ